MTTQYRELQRKLKSMRDETGLPLFIPLTSKADVLQRELVRLESLVETERSEVEGNNLTLDSSVPGHLNVEGDPPQHSGSSPTRAEAIVLGSVLIICQLLLLPWRCLEWGQRCRRIVRGAVEWYEIHQPMWEKVKDWTKLRR